MVVYPALSPRETRSPSCRSSSRRLSAEHEIGVASSEFIETTAAPFYDNGRIVDGTKGLIWVQCLIRGIITRI